MRIVLPYVNGLSVQFRHCLRQQGLYFVLMSETTLAAHLARSKDAVDPTKYDSVVYRIACECGKVYFGETEKAVQGKLIGHVKHMPKLVVNKT